MMRRKTRRKMRRRRHIVLGGPWDSVTAYNWDNNPTYNQGKPYKPIEGGV